VHCAAIVGTIVTVVVTVAGGFALNFEFGKRFWTRNFVSLIVRSCV